MSTGRKTVLDTIQNRYFLDKFNEVGPYYTSYPTLGFWSAKFRHPEYVSALETFFSKEGNNVPLALYIHVRAEAVS